jgi:hypothetical protein
MEISKTATAEVEVVRWFFVLLTIDFHIQVSFFKANINKNIS